MNNTHEQPMLFPEMESSTQAQYKYQIKKIDDPSFGISLTLSDEDDADVVALEHLGYFVVSESNIW